MSYYCNGMCPLLRCLAFYLNFGPQAEQASCLWFQTKEPLHDYELLSSFVFVKKYIDTICKENKAYFGLFSRVVDHIS